MENLGAMDALCGRIFGKLDHIGQMKQETELSGIKMDLLNAKDKDRHKVFLAGVGMTTAAYVVNRICETIDGEKES